MTDSTINPQPGDLTGFLLNKLHRFSTIKLLAVTLVLNIIISVVVAFTDSYFGFSIEENFPGFESITEEVIMVLLLAPVVETIVYQYLIVVTTFYLTKRLFKKEIALLAVIISALAFGFSHFYNIVYIVSTTIAGAILCLFYVVVRARKQNAFIYTTILHTLYNLFAFITKHI